MKNRYSLSKLIYSFLFLTCAISVFAQIPPVQNPREEILTYTPATDYKEPEYTYSFNLKNQLIDMRKSGSGENRVCTVSWLGDEIVKFEKGFFSKELTDNNKNRTYLKLLEEKTNMTRDQLLERLKTECKKDLHQSIIDNSKALCSYFRKVDNYFSK